MNAVFHLHFYPMDAEIIAVGSELLTPFRMDTNSLFLTEQMNQLGVEVIFKSVVGDDRRRLWRQPSTPCFDQTL